MGHKTHPIGFRLGIIKQWNAKWFGSNKAYIVTNGVVEARVKAPPFGARISRLLPSLSCHGCFESAQRVRHQSRRPNAATGLR